MNIQNLKVRTRLGLGFGAMVVVVVGVSSLGMLKMSQIQQRLEVIVNVNNVETAQVMAMRGTVLDRMIALRNMALMTAATDRKPEVERLEVQAKKYSEAEARLGTMFN